MQVTKVLKDFCNTSREIEDLRAHQQRIRKPLQEAKKVSEKILKDNLAVGSKTLYKTPEKEYVVSVKQLSTIPSCTSEVVKKISSLWDDTNNLKENVINYGSASTDLASVVTAHLCDTLFEPRKNIRVEIIERKGDNDFNLPELSPLLNDAVEALCSSRTELKENKAEFRDENLRLKEKKEKTENAMAIELSEASESMRKLNLTDQDGSSQSYYLRLKKPKKVPKRKIGFKSFKKTLLSTLQGTLKLESLLDSSVELFCTIEYRDVFVNELLHKLEALEEPKAHSDNPRVTLDRVRRNPKIENNDT